MRFGSVCSGIEAASVAWSPLGLEAAWFAEIDAFPSAVLNHHYPDVPNVGDMTKLPELIMSGQIEAPEVLVGGPPCQPFSVAGQRRSLDDERGNLSLVFCEIANAIDSVRYVQGVTPAIIVWENVPGVLSTKDNAFGCFLGELAGAEFPLLPSPDGWTNAGYVAGKKRNIAWRILDAQYFGVPQRRRRVFVVASAGKICPAKILFELQCVSRDIESSRKERKEVAGSIESGARITGQTAKLATEQPVCATVSSKWAKGTGGPAGDEIYNLVLEKKAFTQSGFAGYVEGIGTVRASGGDLGGGSETLITVHGSQHPVVQENKANAVQCNNGLENCVYSIAENTIGRQHQNGGNGNGYQENLSYTLNATGVHGVASNKRVRRLTPVECERLQGFPDDWTKIPYRKKSKEDCPDSPRYKAIGNSMAVPVMRWIGERIWQEKKSINKENYEVI